MRTSIGSSPGVSACCFSSLHRIYLYCDWLRETEILTYVRFTGTLSFVTYGTLIHSTCEFAWTWLFFDETWACLKSILQVLIRHWYQRRDQYYQCLYRTACHLMSTVRPVKASVVQSVVRMVTVVHWTFTVTKKKKNFCHHYVPDRFQARDTSK